MPPQPLRYTATVVVDQMSRPDAYSLPVRPANAHVVIVDRDEELRATWTSLFRDHGLRVTEVDSAKRLTRLVRTDPPRVVVLDPVQRRGADWLFIQRLRAHCGIVLVSEKSDVVNKLIGLECGADDYIVRPCDARELLARVRSVLRRISTPGSAPSPLNPGPLAASTTKYPFHGLLLDCATQRVTGAGGVTVVLTGSETAMLGLLVSNMGGAVTRTALATCAGSRGGSDSRVVDAVIARIRAKLAGLQKEASTIRTIRGVGYLLATMEEEEA